MAWLVHEGRVLATVEVAGSARARVRGLLGRDGLDGALLLRPARSVHTIGMRFPIDVAFCDGDLRVVRVVTLARNRITRPVRRARVVIETEAGVMGGWRLRPGDRLELRTSEGSSASRSPAGDDPAGGEGCAGGDGSPAAG